ncbi:MAG: hypothetical protein M2R45_05246 [Verrucomicrobia subdivision 3 bacterium]|nr:hypothetical protein [Limisphaerales bacterium]MCS1416845.1 hypothetical protein [Limisphaerales bacterium]
MASALWPGARDENNFYRFSLNHQNRFRRLMRSIDGYFEILWEDEANIEIGSNGAGDHAVAENRDWGDY